MYDTKLKSQAKKATCGLDYDTLERLRNSHPAWRLLKADQASLIASFLHRIYIAPNIRDISRSQLAEALEDELYTLRERLGSQAFPRSAIDYLNDWASNDKGWLRTFYRHDSDEPFFDLTPATEKAIVWLNNLYERNFVGTESRLLTLFELLKQITEGSEADPQARISELEKRRAEIDAEIARIMDGDMKLLDDTGIKDRFQQFVTVARELLSDFREVEQNFRMLDRSVRERITQWERGKGELLAEVLGERDAIADSDQGRSFRSFWDFLMSSHRQEELTDLLDRVLALPAIAAHKPNPRLRRVHYDWLEAGEHTQRVVAQLSQQLRRFLDDTTWLENRRIIEILHNIESRAIKLRGAIWQEGLMTIDCAGCDIDLPMERRLYSPSIKISIKDFAEEADDSDVDPSSLFTQQFIDTEQLAKQVRQALQQRAQITISDLIKLHPLQHGLTELLAYMCLATSSFKSVVDEDTSETICWHNDDNLIREATLPRIIFVR